MAQPLARFPSHWKLSRVDRVASVNARIGWKALTADEYQSEGYAFLSTPNIKNDQIDFKNVNYISRYRYEESPELKLSAGDVLLVKDGSTLGITNLVRQLPCAATVNGSIAVLRPIRIHAGFLRYALASDLIQGLIGALKGGMGVPHLFQWDIKRLPIPFPPVAEQQQMADFLDIETARIDALIVKKRRMIELISGRLDAKSERIILGLEETNSRPSNTAFFSAVPVDWLETQLRHLGCEVQTGPFGSQLHAEDYADSGWPVINPANIKNGKIVGEGTVRVDDETRSRLSRHVLRAGDIVFGRRGEMGRAGLVGYEEEGWLCGTGSLRLRLTQSALLPDYLKLLLETTVARNYFQLSSVGSTMDNLNSEILLSLPCLVPPGDRQQAIVSAVIRARSRATATMEAIERQVRLLQEHRQALITAAVTGELEVRERARVGA